MRELVIGGRPIGDDSPPYVIADLSHNHLGSAELAREMIRVAAEAGACAVKLQKRGTSTYEGLYNAGEEDYAALRQARELSEEAYRGLRAQAKRYHVDFLCTVFDPESADLLTSVGVDAFKLASGDVTNLPLLEHVARLGKPIILSTGGSDMTDVRGAHRVLSRAGADFALLHCTSAYPVGPESTNLRVIETYRHAFPETVIGFSSHLDRSWGSGFEMAAYALGARIFEKHFTLTPQIATGEHRFALEAEHLYELVNRLSAMWMALGDGQKRVLDCEEQGILRLGKHLVYSRAVDAGRELGPDDFVVVGHGRGLRPNELPGIVGGTLRRRVEAGEDVAERDIARSMAYA